jgi:hypothetical protein
MGFSMLAKDVFQVKEQSVLVVTGLLIGEISVGDIVYVIRPEGDFKAVVVELQKDENGTVVTGEHATTGSVALHIVPQGKFMIGEYDVMTDVCPQHTIDVNVPVINPELSGVLDSYPYYKNDNSFMDHFVYALAHAHLLVPIRVTDESSDDEFAFAALPNQMPGSPQLLPLFTDWAQLGRWSGLAESSENVKTLVLKFSDIADVVASNEYGGIVLNPFSANPVSVSDSMITSITNLEGYKRMVKEQE